MNCPNCGNVMEKGFMHTQKYPFWTQQGYFCWVQKGYFCDFLRGLRIRSISAR